ncbi:MAG: DUF4190 domain-containing protein [Phycisphaerae bacterium]|nr:DUF4190 domain-containing protein [Phycisphaerae bacterium]
MSTPFRCPACGELIAADVAPGQQVRCGACEAVVTVPAMDTPPMSAPPPGMSYPDGGGPPVQTGLAVAALVCGIAGLVICLPAGIVGVIMGIVALLRANREPQRYGGKGLAIGGICTGGLSLLMVPLMIAILLPSLSRARELSKRLVCASNLSGVGMAMDIYASQSNGEFPPDLQILIDNGDVSYKQFICPSSNAVPGDPINTCYIYIPGQTNLSNSRNVLIYEKPENHTDDGANVLFADGHCTFVEPYSRVEDMVRETKQRIAEESGP